MLESINFVKFLAMLYASTMATNGMTCVVHIVQIENQHVYAQVKCEDEKSRWTNKVILHNGMAIERRGWSA